MAPKRKSTPAQNLFIPMPLRLLILPLFLFGSMMMMPTRHSRRTFLDEAFIWNANSYYQTLSTLTFPLSFTVGNGSHCVTSRSHVLSCWSRSFTPTCTGYIVQYLSFSLALEVRASLSHRSWLQMFFMSLGYSFLTILVVSIWGQCPRMSSCLLFVSALLLWVSIFSHHVDLFLKVLDSWTLWWHLFYILFLTITPSQSLVLDFCYLFLSISL